MSDLDDKPGRFEAVNMMPEGWVVLSPLVATPDGYEYREHIREPGRGKDAETWARHLAAQLNALLKEEETP